MPAHLLCFKEELFERAQLPRMYESLACIFSSLGLGTNFTIGLDSPKNT